MNIFSIGFDIDKKAEFFSFLALEKEGDKYKLSQSEPLGRPMGSLLIEFVNLNLESKKETMEFLRKYMIGYYLIEDINVRVLISKNGGLSKEEVQEYAKDIYEDLYMDLKPMQEDFIGSIKHTFRSVAMEIIKEGHKEGRRNVDLSECYFSELMATLYEYEEDILVDFDFPEYCYYSEPDDDGDYNANVEMGFASDFLGNILYISLRKLIFIKNILILECENCHKFFIPESLHNIKYCNRIDKRGKTCREIGAELTYKRKLNEDKALKRYRSRYSSLSSNVSNYPESEVALKRLEEFKKVGAEKKKLYSEGKISQEDFIKWIESTKVK